MIRKFSVPALAIALAACSSVPLSDQGSSVEGHSTSHNAGNAKTSAVPSVASTVDAYKVDLAHRISQVNASGVYPGRPQALLRSVIVLRYTVDADGNLLRSDVLRSNQDSVTVSAALASLKKAAPFPRPARHLLRNGRIDVSESWLFNSDGRFQLRSIAQAQLEE